MTKEEIIQIAKKCGWDNPATNMMPLYEFAVLVASAEREACAKMCDYVYDNIVTDEHIKAMAFKIRTRGQK